MIASILKALWAKLDGKKTLIGLLVLGFTFLEAQYPGALVVVAEAVKQVLEAGGVEIGGAVTALGLAHKVKKVI